MAERFSWKILLGPGMLLGLKLAKIDLQSPQILVIVRAVYGLSQLLLLGLCSLIAHRIRSRGDEKRTLRVVSPQAPLPSGEAAKETRITFKEYDMGELTKLAKNFVLGTALTVGIHVYMQVLPALVLQIASQPMTLLEHPLFAIYVLNKDPDTDNKLKRPFPDKSLAARMEAMKKEAQEQKELQEQENRANTESLPEGEAAPLPEKEESSGGSAKTCVSVAEKRPNRSSG